MRINRLVKPIKVTREFANTLNYGMQAKVLLQQPASHNGKISDRNRNIYMATYY